MKKLGLIGGMGPESTLLYYKEIASEFHKKNPHGYFPALTIETVNMYEMLNYCKNQDYIGLTSYLMKAINNVISSGADFIALASNTPHVVFDKLQENSSIPMLSIVEPIYKAIKSMGMKKIGWLGTAFTMEEDYFKKIFVSNGIDVIIPEKIERAYIDNAIASELEFGIVKEETKKIIDSIIQRLVEQEGIEGLIIGCTELPLIYENVELPIPCFDTMRYHIEGIVKQMLNN